MVEELLKAIPVYLFSMLKFILGPSLGFAAKLHFITTMIVTVGGMMTIVFAITYFGDWINEKIITRFFKRRKFTPVNRRFANIWKKYGLTGIAFLTPLLLTPIGGTLLAVSSGSPREKIILFMFVSATFWGLVFTSIIYFVGEKALPDFVRP